MQTKRCTTCGEEKEISEFIKSKLGKFGVNSMCKSCTKIYFEVNKERFHQNRKEHIEGIPDYHKICYQNNKEARKASSKKWWKNLKNTPELYQQALLKDRNVKLKKKFGITLEEYNQILESQNGVCAICGKEETDTDWRSDKVKQLAVDHNHETGKVRALLCGKCNKAIGLLKDNIQLFQATIDYLNKYKG
jgi:hypothetical protein